MDKAKKDTHYKLPASLIPAVQLAMQTNPQAMVTVLNRKEIFCFVSPSVTPLFGYLPGEVVGRHFAEFFNSLDAATIRLALLDAAIYGQSVSITRHVLLKTGGYRKMQGPARAITDSATGELYELAIGWKVHE